MQQSADAAAVSRMTVSLALRNHPRISPETRARVQQVARELGYHPDAEVSKLMSYLRRAKPPKHASTIGLITTAAEPQPWRFNQHFRKFYEGATRRANESGYRLEEFWLKEPGLTSRRLTSILDTRAVEGLLIGPMYNASGHLSIDFSRFAAAEYGQNVWRPRLHRADHNHFQGMLLAVRQLERIGHTRIGLALFEGFDRRVVHTWEGAYLYSQQDFTRGDRVPPLVSKMLDRDAFFRWFQRHRPDAVISSHREVLDWLGSHGARVPQDVGFAFLDWLDESDSCAGINQHYGVVAAAAIDLIVQQIHRNEHGIPAHPKLVLIEGDWVDGPTVRKRR
jgi:DNA-binding LacI/PurR family transcriptional regulator